MSSFLLLIHEVLHVKTGYDNFCECLNGLRNIASRRFHLICRRFQLTQIFGAMRLAQKEKNIPQGRFVHVDVVVFFIATFVLFTEDKLYSSKKMIRLQLPLLFRAKPWITEWWFVTIYTIDSEDLIDFLG